MIHFDLPKEKSSIIKVIGVGGGGSNAVNHMFSQSIDGVNFIICNTDAQAIAQSHVPNKIQLGPHLTQGFQVNATGARFLLSTVHLRSKLCDGASGGRGSWRRSLSTLSSTSKLTLRAFRSTRRRSPVRSNDRPPPTADSGDMLRIDGLAEVPL